MTSETEPQDPNSIDRDRLIDSICDDFEACYMASERPQIEALLQRLDGPNKQRLLIELIAIDMHHRRHLTTVWIVSPGRTIPQRVANQSLSPTKFLHDEKFLHVELCPNKICTIPV